MTRRGFYQAVNRFRERVTANAPRLPQQTLANLTKSGAVGRAGVALLSYAGWADVFGKWTLEFAQGYATLAIPANSRIFVSEHVVLCRLRPRGDLAESATTGDPFRKNSAPIAIRSDSGQVNRWKLRRSNRPRGQRNCWM